MNKFTIQNLSDIAIEAAHGGSGSRQLLVTPEKLTSPYFEAWVKTRLESGKIFDWHEHADIDEMFMVINGIGKFYWEDEVINYKVGDVVTIPTNSKHKIEALGAVASEFYFIRVKSK